MEKKKDYNYLFDLANKLDVKIDSEVQVRKIITGGIFIDFTLCSTKETQSFASVSDACEWLEEQLQPTYEDALQFISDNEVEYTKETHCYYVYYACDSWYIKQTDVLVPHVKYMTEEKCKEFIEKFKNVKPN